MTKFYHQKAENQIKISGKIELCNRKKKAVSHFPKWKLSPTKALRLFNRKRFYVNSVI